MSIATDNGMEDKEKQVRKYESKIGVEVKEGALDSVDCFHGFITEEEVEYRLRKCKIDGALILHAEQNSITPKFCLSWLPSVSNSVMHLSIDQVCGEYFLFGKSFTTLSDLIQTFVNESKTAVLPLQPPSPVKLVNRQRIAVLPFRAMPDTNEISFCEGDLLTEIQRVDNEWAWARLEKNGKSGLVALQLTVPLNDKNVKPEELPYFHDEPINVLTQRLTQYTDGCYLLRHSFVQSSSYTLMVNIDQHIEKFQIKRTADGNFEIDGQIFATIPDIIERYSEKEICKGFHLTRAVLTKASDRDLSGKNADKKFQDLVTNSFRPQTVLAYRRCKEDKWKRCYVTLNDSNGSQLYVLDDEKRAKPKVVLDLGFCFVYKIPEGSFDRANCLLVASNSMDIYPSVHLSFQNEGTYLNWLNELRLRCLGCRYSPSPFAVIPAIQDYFIRSTTVIYLTLTSFRGSDFKPDTSYSAVVTINGIFLTKTQQVMPAKNTIIFNRCFLLQYIPPGSCSLKFVLCSHNLPPTKTRNLVFRDYLQKDISPLYLLADDGKELCVENNFEGFVFRAVRHRIVLLPEEQYASFFVLLTSRSFILSIWIGSVLDIFNRKYFARLLLSVLLPNYDLLMSFVEVIIREQIKRETEVTLFRCDSFCTCCISTVLRMTGKDLVTEELANLLTGGLPKQELEIMSALKNLSEHLPLLFRAILSHTIKTAKAYFDDSKYVARRVASVFFILRFVNPILTFNCSGSPEQSRQLPKTIQSLANQASSPDYCPEKGTPSVRLMADLLDAIALSPSKVESSENPFCGYSKIDQLALLAFQVERVLEQQDCDSCPLPEAYTVISLLKKHAEKYLSC
ncbi:SH2 domain containing protein [Brugia malayi]|nr:SH2 domain containing protein [Brugia malayi]VIO97144.1 SH2 domain containing protein [Brugia malayi]